MQKWKRVLKAWMKGGSILMLAGSLLFLGGCGRENPPDNARQSSLSGEDTKSVTLETAESMVYSEKTLELPEGINNIYDIREVGNQVLMVTDQSLLVSDDRGDTWSKAEGFPEKKYSAAAIGPEGEVAWCDGSQVITLWKRDGSLQELHSDFSEEKYCYTMEFLSGSKLWMMDTGSNIQVLDIARDKITGTISAEGGYHLLVCGVNEKILAWSQNGRVEIFDDTGENAKPCDQAEQLFARTETDGLGVGNYGVLAADSDDTGFFYACRRGLFHYTLGGSVTEQLMEGGQYSMGDNHYRMLDLSPLANGSFLILYMDDDSMGFRLKRYDMLSAKELENRTELTLYTLYDSDMLRQELNVLMQENSDYVISVQVGVTGENSVTGEDAVKKLNTEIMAGEGPDLILLDGMAVESYMAKGLLADLSEVLEQVDQKEGLARNITDVFSDENGIYAVPARFRMPLMAGEEADIETITDLNSLEECVERLKGENPELSSILGIYGKMYFETLFDICGPAWISEDGINREKLKEFLEIARRMQEVQQQGVSGEKISEVTKYSDYFNAGSYGNEIDMVAGVRGGYQSLAVYQSESLNASMALMVSGLAFDFAKGQCGHVFVPKEIIGVNAASPNGEKAKEFVQDFLSAASQSQFVLQDMAYPVNKTALRDSMEAELNSRERLESWLEGTDAAKEDVKAGLERIIEMTDELDTCALNDDILRNIVLEHGMKYLDGQEELEQAVNSILQSVELRMAEK